MSHRSPSPILHGTLLALCSMLVFNANATLIELNPPRPIPGDAPTLTLTFDSCVRFDRWERSGSRIVIYANRSNLSPCPGGGTREISPGALVAGNYSVEVFERAVGGASPPDGFTKVAERRFLVAQGQTSAGKPAKIGVVGSKSIVRGSLVTTEIAFSVRDASGNAVPDTPLGLRVVSASSTPSINCDPLRVGSGCTAHQTQPDGSFAVYVAPPNDSEGAQVTTVIGSTRIDGRTQSTFATVGYIDSLRQAAVIPVVEYEIDAAITSPPTRYFLSADEATSDALDSVPDVFRRTYAAFFGVKANTPTAVPVCRFFSNGKNGVPLTHWFTADAADCAAKKADPRYVDEGVAFWAYPPSLNGACPRGTRGVTRYLLTVGSDASAVSVRYSTLLSMRNQAVVGTSLQGDVKIRDDGVAFCVPD